MFSNPGFAITQHRSNYSSESLSSELESAPSNGQLLLSLARSRLTQIDDLGDQLMSGMHYAREAENSPSLSDNLPTTPEPLQETAVFEQIDESGFAVHAFLHAGVPLTSKGISERNYSCSLY